MKWLVWSVFALLAAGWTGLIALAHWMAAWLARGMAATLPDGPPSGSTPWPLPSWLEPWLDPAWREALTGFLMMGGEAVKTLLPHLANATSWLPPLLWIGWGFGMAALLLLALCGHWLAGRAGPPGAQARAA